MSNALSYGDALSWLDGHINLERNSHSEFPAPSLVKIREALRALGEPEKNYSSVHVTGTNGKGTTVRMISALLMAHGLRVGTYSSPHLEKLNERIMVDLQPISDSDLHDELYTLMLLEGHTGVRLSWFELVSAAAFSHFDTVGIDVAVVEVGMGGRWDATNVIDGDVCVVTNVSLDHADILGPELSDIAKEKSGIIKPESRVVLGVDQPDLLPIFLEAPNDGVSILGTDITVRSNVQAISGRVISVKTKHAHYEQVFIPLFGRHQGTNAALAIGAVEEFFDRPLDEDVVRAALERVTSPGRMEVLLRSPLVIVDAAHNPAGMLSAKDAILGDFASIRHWHLVVSMLNGRDPFAMFTAVQNDKIASLSLASARSLRAMDMKDMAEGASSAGIKYLVFDTVPDALDHAIKACKEDEGVLVCGSIYTISEARETIIKR